MFRLIHSHQQADKAPQKNRYVNHLALYYNIDAYSRYVNLTNTTKMYANKL